MSHEPNPREPQVLVVDYKETSDIRPSPYLYSFWFSFVIFCAKFGAVACIVLGLASLVAGASGVENGINGGLNAIAASSIFLAAMYILKILADIEQHTFRSAQMLTKIVESQAKRKAN